ncbi:hypothetical protein MKX01_027371 [Papaver californicum]|nr:hypothetical protein MKX01_027371 [Papaver californicum]
MDPDYAVYVAEATESEEDESETGSASGGSEEEDEEEEEEEEEGEGEVEVVPVVQNAAEVVNVEDTEEEGEDCGKDKGETCTAKQSQGDLGNEIDGVCCGICMEPWSSEGDHQVSCLPCGHVYGLACIKKWIQQCRRGPSKCPQCGRKCTVKNIIKLYVSRLVVTDGAQEQKLHSLKAANDFLKMQMADLKEKVKQDKEAWLNKERVKRQCVENVSLGDAGIRSVRYNSEPMLNGRNHGLNPAAGQGYPPRRFKLLDELTVDGGRVFDMDFSHDVLLLAQRQHAMDGEHVLTKISLLHPYESERIKLLPGSKFVKDLHISPCGKLALCASLGKKASILSMERNNFVIKYELPAPAWSCSWDLDSEHHMYTGLQNGMLLLFDMRQTSGPVESMNGLTSHPVHTIHSLPDNSPLHNGGRSVLTASSIGPCVWKTGHTGERPILLPALENQGVCISLAYSPITDDIVASFRPRVQTPNDVVATQPSLSPSPPGRGQGVMGSHFLIKRVGGNSYHYMGSTLACVNNIRLQKSVILNLENRNPLFVYGDETTSGLGLRELPSLCTAQSLNRNQNAILDIKYSGTSERGLLGCVSEDRLQLFYLPRGPDI